MSDLLSGLRKDIAAGNWTTNDLPSALACNQALHDVREALTNPTDEQVEQGAKALAARMELWPEQRVDDEWSALTPADRADWITLTREAWAAAAGGDDD